MVEGGFTPIDGGSVSVDDDTFPAAFYDGSPEATARQELCHQRIEAFGIIKPPTPEQWAAFYPHLVAFNDCLRTNGYDVETVVSLGEYVSSGGNPPVSPKLDALAHADDAGPKYRECLDRELIPYTPILRT